MREAIIYSAEFSMCIKQRCAMISYLYESYKNIQLIEILRANEMHFKSFVLPNIPGMLRKAAQLKSATQGTMP